MKRLILCGSILGLMLSPKNNSAQSVPLVIESSHTFFYRDSKNSIISNVPLNELNAKAYRYFIKNYPSVTNETWIKVPKGLVVTFTHDSVFCKIYYAESGAFSYSYKYCEETSCKDELKKMVRTAYPSYHIISVTELDDLHKLVYGIRITNNDVIKTLEMNNGEVKMLDEYQVR